MADLPTGSTPPVAANSTPALDQVLESRAAARAGKPRAAPPAPAPAPVPAPESAAPAPTTPAEVAAAVVAEVPPEAGESPGEAPAEEEKKAGKGFAELSRQSAKFRQEKDAFFAEQKRLEAARATTTAEQEAKIAAGQKELAAFEQTKASARHSIVRHLGSLGITSRDELIKAADQIYYHLVDDKAPPEVQQKKLAVTLDGRLAEINEQVEKARLESERTIGELKGQQQLEAARAHVHTEIRKLPETMEIINAVAAKRPDYVVNQLIERGHAWAKAHPGETPTVEKVALAWEEELAAQLEPVTEMITNKVTKKYATSAEQSPPAPKTLPRASQSTRQTPEPVTREEKRAAAIRDLQAGKT